MSDRDLDRIRAAERERKKSRKKRKKRRRRRKEGREEKKKERSALLDVSGTFGLTRKVYFFCARNVSAMTAGGAAADLCDPLID